MFFLYVAAPLVELFYRANVRLLLWLNGYFAAHASLYKLALFLTDRGSDLLMLLTLLLLWFWPRNEHSQALFGDAPLTTKLHQRAWMRDFLASVTHENSSGPIVTRGQSRAQVLILVGSSIVAYLVARFIAYELDVTRPLASYWLSDPPVSLSRVAQSLWRPGSFPGDYAAMIASFAAGLFFWNGRLGWFWTGIAVVLSLCYVAVGFHYPLDMIAGAVIGVACVWLSLTNYQQRGVLYRWGNQVARDFERNNAPYCYILYFLTLLFFLEAMTHFEHLLTFLFAVRGALLQPFGR